MQSSDLNDKRRVCVRARALVRDCLHTIIKLVIEILSYIYIGKHSQSNNKSLSLFSLRIKTYHVKRWTQKSETERRT